MSLLKTFLFNSLHRKYGLEVNITTITIIIIINSFYVDIQNNLQMSKYVNKLDYNPSNKHTKKNSSLVLL